MCAVGNFAVGSRTIEQVFRMKFRKKIGKWRRLRQPTGLSPLVLDVLRDLDFLIYMSLYIYRYIKCTRVALYFTTLASCTTDAYRIPIVRISPEVHRNLSLCSPSFLEDYFLRLSSSRLLTFCSTFITYIPCLRTRIYI